jgi:hypothetical protein
MKIKLYQINLDRDPERLAFIGYDKAKDKIDCESYDRVFEGEVPCNNLEDIFEMFNIDTPDSYVGRSMSVSDVVEIVDGTDQVKPGFYFCDNYGFQKIEFEPDKASQMSPFLRVVLVEPGKLARPADIDPSLAGLQKVVGGCIEVYYPFEEQVCIVCNDEGKLNSMKLNRGIYGDNGELMDIIAGPFFICDCSGCSFGSLTSEQIERYTKQFKYPERFFKMGNEIKAVPYDPRLKNVEERT